MKKYYLFVFVLFAAAIMCMAVNSGQDWTPKQLAQIDDFKEMSPDEFAVAIQEALESIGLDCNVGAEVVFGEKQQINFVCDFTLANANQQNIWSVVGAIVGGFYFTTFVPWDSNNVYLAVDGQKVAYITTADCRRLYTFISKDDMDAYTIEVTKALVIMIPKK